MSRHVVGARADRAKAVRSDARVGIDTASTPVHRLINGDARGESQAKLQVGGQ